MTFQPPNYIDKPEQKNEKYDGPIDRFLIFVGDAVTKYAFVLLVLAFFGLVGSASVLGGAFMIREVNQRFNELEAREQGRQILLEQKQEQITDNLEDQSQRRIKKDRYCRRGG